MPNVADWFLPRSGSIFYGVDPQNCLQLHQLSLMISDWPMYRNGQDHGAQFLAFIFGVNLGESMVCKVH